MRNIIDLGKLGEWSINTLKIQAYRTYRSWHPYQVDLIEDKYAKLRYELINSRDNCLKGFIIFSSVRDLYHGFSEANLLQKQIDEIDRDYDKYLEYMKKLKGVK